MNRPVAAALAAAALATLGPMSFAAADELKPFEASYGWSWHGLSVAVSTLKLAKQDDSSWSYSSRSEPRGIGHMFSERPTQLSILQVTDSGTRPLSYKADDGTPSTKRDADVQFDWEHNRVTGTYEDTRVDMPLQPGIQDDLSVQVALMVELLRGHTPEKFLMLDKNSVREYRYVRDAQETLATPWGAVSTVIYEAHKAGSPRVTRFWCDPTRGFLPMRVQQVRGTEVQWTMQIEKLNRE